MSRDQCVMQIATTSSYVAVCYKFNPLYVHVICSKCIQAPKSAPRKSPPLGQERSNRAGKRSAAGVVTQFNQIQPRTDSKSFSKERRGSAIQNRKTTRAPKSAPRISPPLGQKRSNRAGERGDAGDFTQFNQIQPIKESEERASEFEFPFM